MTRLLEWFFAWRYRRNCTPSEAWKLLISAEVIKR